MQDKWIGHSLLLIHSGLQLGGEPINSDKQEHDGDSPCTLHWEFGPQGDGIHGFPTGWGTSAAKIKNKNNFYSLYIFYGCTLNIIQVSF